VSSHVVVDETKERDYLLIASVHVSGNSTMYASSCVGLSCVASVACT